MSERLKPGVGARRALVTSAAVIYGAFLGAHVVGAPPGLAAALLALVCLPYLYAIVRAHDPFWSRRPVLAAGVATVVQLLPFGALALSRLDLVGPAALAFLFGHFLQRSRDVRAAGAALALGPLYVLAEMTLQPEGLWLAAFAATVLISVFGLVQLARRETRRLAYLRAPVVLRSEVDGRFLGELGRGGGGPYAALLGGLVLVLLPLAYLPLAFLPDPSLESRREDEPELPPEDAEGEPLQDPARSDAAETLGRVFPSEALLGGGGVEGFEHEIVMQVVPEPPRDLGAIYLRAMVLDTIRERGATTRGGTRSVPLADADDGRRDGWTLTDTAPRGSRTITIDVLQQAIPLRGGSVLFAPRPFLGARVPALEHDPDGVSLVPSGDSVWLEHRLRYATPPALPSRAERSPDARYLQLPRDSEALAPIRLLALQVARGARDDRERVARVLSYFRDNFDYALTGVEVPGLLGVLDFLEEQRGHCTYYAVASTLMLRTLGIPTRVATGFLASAWDAEEGAYTVTRKNAHAWIEVEFEDVGWIPLDPTPAGPRDAALASIGLGRSDGISGWLGGVGYDLDSWVKTGDSVFLRHFLGSLLQLPVALFESLRARPWLALPLGLVVALALLGWLRRARGSRPAARIATAPSGSASSGAEAHLVRALAALGHRRRPAQTPLEFAHAVTARAPLEVRELGEWTERLYRARYGGEPLNADEQSAFRSFVAAVQRAAASSLEPAQP